MSLALMSAWNKTCEMYREGCNLYGSCVADYDPREGTISAENGAQDLVSGTTASLVAMDYRADEINILNCGDSRTIVLADKSSKHDSDVNTKFYVDFATRDHKPSDENEIKRLRSGKASGLNYSEPECSLSRYWITVGDYQYSVSRSLEGTQATSKGIVSDADVTKLNICQLVPDETTRGAIVIGSDGLFDVISDQEVAVQMVQMMKNDFLADKAAKELCQLALKKGSSDNISVIIIYFSL